MSAAPVFCPRCEAEYLASATECVDCGVPLVPASRLAERTADELPAAQQLVLIRASSVGWARNLSGLLADAGISHRIEAVSDDEGDDLVRRRPNAQLPFGVYVRAEDRAAARAIDEAHMRSEIPDLPEDMQGASAADTCPACGATVAADAAECGDCGLALAFEE